MPVNYFSRVTERFQAVNTAFNTPADVCTVQRVSQKARASKTPEVVKRG